MDDETTTFDSIFLMDETETTTFFPTNSTNELTTITNITASSESYKYCSPGWANFLQNFPPNGQIVNINLAIGCIGTVTNILCLLVFFQKNQRNATNFILASIASCDLIIMLSLITRGIILIESVETALPFFARFMQIVGRVLYQLFHCLSVWITMTLAIWRYIAIVYPLKSRAFCTMTRARWTILILFLIIAALDFHEYVQIKLVAADPAKGPAQGGCGKPYCYDYTDFTKNNVKFMVNYSQWYQALIGGQIIPCIILTVVSIRLIIALVQAQHNRNRMMSAKDKEKGSERAKNQIQTQAPPTAKKKQTEFDKTAQMLLVVLIVFVLTEAPVGAFNICALVLDVSFSKECFLPLNVHLVTLNVISGATNFVIYVVMSVNFRKALLGQVFCIKKYSAKSQSMSTKSQSTTVSTVRRPNADSTV